MKWVASFLAVSAILLSGCTTNRYSGFNESLRPMGQSPVLAAARQSVYAFLMNGADVLEVGDFATLPHALSCAGYPKAYYGQSFDGDWFEREMHRIHAEEPDARFILVGYGSAAGPTRDLGSCVSQAGLPLDAVVYLDPIEWFSATASKTPFRTVTIRSHHWRAGPRVPCTAPGVLISDTGHLTLPSNRTTLQVIVELMTESALRVPPLNTSVECLPLRDGNRPIPRPSDPKEVKPAPPGWEFLCPAGR